MPIPTVGATPGRRYGHTIVYCNPHIIVFGGNIGNETKNDVWSFNVEKSPFSWIKIDTGTQDAPSARVYHTAAVCNCGSASGMMVIFGGRTADSAAVNDTWGFRRHRNGKWDWVKAPYKSTGEKPTGRYQVWDKFSYFL